MMTLLTMPADESADDDTTARHNVEPRSDNDPIASRHLPTGTPRHENTHTDEFITNKGMAAINS